MKKIITNIFALTLLFALVGCASSNNDASRAKKSSSTESSQESAASSNASSESSSSSEDQTTDTREIRENKLYTDSGLTVEFSTTGAAISKISWDNTQIAKDGFVVGRCANRIANAQFTLNGQQYDLDKNDNSKHSLHGGSGSGWNSWRGPFATATWTKETQTSPSTIVFNIHSNDKANGYPGNMDMSVKYTLSQAGELTIEYSATSDADTLWNPTNHLYMNMNGSRNQNYSNVNLMIDANSYTPLDSEKIPTGSTASVEGTKFDYRTETAFRSSEEYDDNYVLNGTGYRKVASMSGTTGGYKVDVFTDRPGLQLYKAGNGDICLESQMMPDAINQNDPVFVDPILRAGETLTTKTAYVFSKLA